MLSQFVQTQDKFIALLTLDSVGIIDQTHPVFTVLEEYATHISELHIFVFLEHRQNVSKKEHVVHIRENMWIYYISPLFIPLSFFNSFRIRSLINRNLVWKKKFRPDFVLTFSTEEAGTQAKKIATKYKKPFFVENPCHFLYLAALSPVRQKKSLLVLSAHRVFVPTETIRTLLLAELGCEEEKIQLAPPAISLESFDVNIIPFSYSEAHPNYRVFCVTYMLYYEHHVVKTLIEVMKKVVSAYPLIATTLFVPLREYKKIKSLIAPHIKETHIFVKAEPVSMLPYYRGAHLSLFLTEHDDINMPVIEALASHSPVVTTEAGFAGVLLKGTPYARYLIIEKDIENIANQVLYLVGNSQARDEYRINGYTLLENRFFDTTASHVQKVVTTIFDLFKK